MIRNSAVVHIHRDDNVSVAIRLLERHDEIPGRSGPGANGTVQLTEKVRPGHKVALEGIGKGEAIIKYGQIIGFALSDIAAGGWVHSHNVGLTDFARDYAPATAIPPAPEPLEGHTFQGYRRLDGRAGTRNYVAVISTVNCSATTAKYIADKFDSSQLSEFPNIDGIVSFTHHGGCAMSWRGETHEMLNRVMGGIARHPNIGAYLLVGLGCEQAAMGYLVESQGLVQIDGFENKATLPPVFSMQDMGGTQKTIDAAVAKLSEILPQANDVTRETIPASEIILATECGGSDGNSGITANPALGIAADRIVACGGTAILAETTEIYGAEHLLTRRAVTVEVAEKLIERIEWWKDYVHKFGGELDNNPSVGNKEGGLTTIAEKSLGAVAKGGSTALTEVYRYAEPVTKKGFVVMDTPGFDPPSVTGMVAGGANVVVFTTGRGSCFGCKPTPSIKVASNTLMYERMIDDMDFNAGVVLEGRSVTEVGEELFREILDVASGKQTKSEELGLGDEEFVPWTIGPVL
jgi:altronate hydrolase